MIFVGVVIRRFGHYPAEYSAVLIWGGLRGSLALLLALGSKGDEVFEAVSRNRTNPPDEEALYRTTLAFISITVVLSNLIQSVTSGPLTRKLRLVGMSAFQVAHLKTVTKHLNEHLQTIIATKKEEKQYGQVDWRYVEKHVKINVHLEREEMHHEDRPEDDPEEEAREMVQRCYEAQLWNLWNSGILSVDTRALQNAIAEAASSHGPLNVQHLYDHLKSSKIRRTLGLFCIKWKSWVDATRCRWFADRPQLMDGWYTVAATISCFQGVFYFFN